MTNPEHATASSPTRITGRIFVEERGEEVVFFSREASTAAKPRLIKKTDIRASIYLLTNLFMAASMPRSAWPGCINFLAGRRFARQMRKKLPAFTKNLGAVLGQSREDEAVTIFRAMQEVRSRGAFAIAANLASPRWKPDITLHGLDGLKRALERGHGAIVWCHQFTAQNLIGKRALYEAGYPGHQVSVSEHGFSNTAYARRFLNPILVRLENRYLASRIVFDPADTLQVTRRIRSVLGRNEIVLMNNNLYSGSKFIEVALGASGYFQMASTPLNFAARTGTALFTMSTFETTPFDRYEAVISPEIPVARTETTFRHDAMAKAALIVRDHLCEGLAKYPEQFMPWGQQLDISAVSCSARR
jgi:lauroyl/myristoyl acyltransferase